MSRTEDRPAFTWTPAQDLSIRTEGRDLLVAAGAGAGKTTVLVERILRKLRERVIEDLDQILVVTFTEKAARQMKSRIYDALTQDPELRHYLPQLSRARISTIHAFCSRLLRENFLLAGVEPGFHVLDDHGRTEALEEALRQTFHRWYVRNDDLGEEFGRLVELAGFDEQGESLRVLVRRLHEFARTTTDPEGYLDHLAEEKPPVAIEEVSWLEELEVRLASRWEQGRDLYEEMLRRLEEPGRLKTVIQRDVLARLYDYPERPFRNPGAAETYLGQLRAGRRLSTKGGLGLDWGRLPTGGGKIPGVKDLHETAKTLIGSVVRMLGISAADLLAEESRRRKSLGVLVRLVREMDAIYEAYKRRGGWLDYSDLEVHAARMLSGPTDLGLRFREVLVDEYQDVNALQERILSAVADPGGSFRVGDVKQSIYGFRLADPTIFLAVLRRSLPLRGPEESGEGPAAIYMNENYRSRPGVLRVVNQIFARVFDSRTIGSDYGEQALEAGRPEDGGSGFPVELHFIDIKTDRAAPDLPSAKQLALSDAWIDATELEPRYVAKRLRVLAGDSVLTDPGTGSVDWSRVAVLLRSSTRASLYADALRREGIPVELGSGGSLFDEPIVRDLRSVLRTVDNPRDDVALASTMRCPSFGFGSADLLRIRLAFPGAGSFLDAVVGVAYGEEDPVPDALFPPGETERFGEPDAGWAELAPEPLRVRCRTMLEQIVAWRGEEAWSELGQFVARVADAIHLVPLGFAGGDGSRQRACLQRFLGLARAYETERGPSLHGFLSRLDLLDEAGAVDTVPTSRGESGGVRILTVHKSKGLEFPVVVVPQLDWRVSTKDRLASRIRIDRDWVGLRWFDPESYTRRESVARQLLEWRQEEALREEEARILYVAMTRAEERLLLFGMQRGIPEAEPIPEGVWEYERRHASTMLSWIVGALPWGELEAQEPVLLRTLGLVPDPVPTYAEYHQRLGTGDPALGPDEMSAAPPAGGEYRLGGIRICRVSKVVLAAALAEAGRDSDPLADEADPAGALPPIDPAASVALADPDVGETYDLFAVAAPDSRASADVGVRADADAGASVGTDGDANVDADAVAATDTTIAAVTNADADAGAAVSAGVLSRVLTRRPTPPVAQLTRLRGKYWVTEFKSEADFERYASLREEATAFWLAPAEEEAVGATASGRPASARSVPEPEPEPVLEPAPIDEPGARRPSRAGAGTFYHTWLARVPMADLVPERVRAALDAEAEQDLRWIDVRDEAVEAGLARFLDSEWGQRLVAVGNRAEREVPFSLKWSVDDLCQALPELSREIAEHGEWSPEEWRAELARHWVLLQGRLDCVFPHEDGWVVLDWKTDRVPSRRVDERAETYRSQMGLYRDAVRNLWGGPVTSVLVFLVPGEVRIASG